MHDWTLSQSHAIKSRDARTISCGGVQSTLSHHVQLREVVPHAASFCKCILDTLFPGRVVVGMLWTKSHVITNLALSLIVVYNIAWI